MRLTRLLVREGTCAQERAEPSRSDTRRMLAAVLALVLLMCAASIVPRLAWFGTYGVPRANASTGMPEASEALTAIALRITNEWLHAPSSFIPYFPTYETAPFNWGGDRVHTATTIYSPLYLMPLYIPARMLGVQPTVAWAMCYGWITHCATALLGTAFVFLAILSVSKKLVPAALFSLASAVVLVFHPAPMYMFQALYWPDSLIIPFFIVMMLLESLRDAAVADGRNTRRLDVGIALAFFTGMLVEFFTISIFMSVLLKRLWFWQCGQTGKSIRNSMRVLCVPMVLAGCVLTAHYLVIGGLFGLLFPLIKYIAHSGLVADEACSADSYSAAFWNGYFVQYYSDATKAFFFLVLAGSTIALIAFWLSHWRRREAIPDGEIRLMGMVFISTASCFLYTCLLRQHAAENDRAILKFVVPLSCVTLAFLPAIVGMMTSRWRNTSTIIATAALLVAVAATAANTSRYRTFFWQGTHEYERIGKSIMENVPGNELIIGPRLYKQEETALGEMTKFAASAGRWILWWPYHQAEAQERAANQSDVSVERDVTEPAHKPFHGGSVVSAGPPTHDAVIIVAPEPLTDEEKFLKEHAMESWSSDELQYMRFPAGALARLCRIFRDTHSGLSSGAGRGGDSRHDTQEVPTGSSLPSREGYDSQRDSPQSSWP